MPISAKYVCLFLVAFFIAAIFGCGDSVRSGGAVKFEDGAPLTEGVIYFSDAQHEFSGRIKNDGSFSIGGIKEGDGLPPGQYQVHVTFPSILDPKEWPVDKKFTAPETSGLNADVQSGGKNQFDFTVNK